MEKQKTALQELIKKLEQNIQDFLNHYNVTSIDELNTMSIGCCNAYLVAINEAKSLLPAEREQINEAYNIALDGGLRRDYKSALVYFDDTYEITL